MTERSIDTVSILDALGNIQMHATEAAYHLGFSDSHWPNMREETEVMRIEAELDIMENLLRDIRDELPGAKDGEQHTSNRRSESMTDEDYYDYCDPCDYYVIAYQILAHLYQCMKFGLNPRWTCLSNEALGIGESYWKEVIRELRSKGYIKGDGITSMLAWSMLQGPIQITHDGIEFMRRDSNMKRAKRFLMTWRDGGKECAMQQSVESQN